MSTNPISFRLPPNLKGKAHDDVVQTIQDHDNLLVNHAQAFQTVASQISALQAQVKALQNNG